MIFLSKYESVHWGKYFDSPLLILYAQHGLDWIARYRKAQLYPTATVHSLRQHPQTKKKMLKNICHRITYEAIID